MVRILDVVLATLVIISLLLLLVPLIVILKLTGEHEIFYRQERIGKGGERFFVLKFATMLKDSPNLPGGYLTRKNDPRVLRVGRILRKTKINELPQLFNVLLGQMSFVGPRPQAKVHYDLYSAEQKAAIDLQTPGLTGVAALVFRSEEDLLERFGEEFEYYHDHVITPYKGELERWYAANKSVGLYLKIIFLTAVSIVRPDINFLRFFPGAPKPGSKLAAVLNQVGGESLASVS